MLCCKLNLLIYCHCNDITFFVIFATCMAHPLLKLKRSILLVMYSCVTTKWTANTALPCSSLTVINNMLYKQTKKQYWLFRLHLMWMVFHSLWGAHTHEHTYWHPHESFKKSVRAYFKNIYVCAKVIIISMIVLNSRELYGFLIFTLHKTTFQ